ncbi:hypothetical protein QF117_08480 [Vibrio sp. YMD68]|nr:hypothetical protein [Vibrio sp. YMD68]WGW00848.1 hypothetical protein QF117_08480 [Vibrio sp. YMD68]
MKKKEERRKKKEAKFAFPVNSALSIVGIVFKNKKQKYDFTASMII